MKVVRQDGVLLNVRDGLITQAAKDWTAEQWAEWTAGFLGWKKVRFQGCLEWRDRDDAYVYLSDSACDCCDFCPLHDANHLMLVLDEIERRGCYISLHADPDDDPDKKYSAIGNRSKGACGECGWAKTECFEGEAPTRNLAVLLAAHALEQS